MPLPSISRPELRRAWAETEITSPAIDPICAWRSRGLPTAKAPKLRCPVVTMPDFAGDSEPAAGRPRVAKTTMRYVYDGKTLAENGKSTSAHDEN